MIPFSEKSLILAPMAGVTDSGFRKICRKYGCDVTVTEMVSTKGIFYKDKKTFQLLNFESEEQPLSIQIFGNDVECYKVASEFITDNYSPISIDINMGCPAPKIFNNGDGSALMGNMDTAYKIITAVKDNTDLPVSVKFRSGISDKKINAVEFAKMCESAGTDYITVHGRTRDQFYSGNANYEIIKNVVESVNIPVIANGDIIDSDSAKYVLDYTGAHSLMIGRAAMGNPLIFDEIKNKRKTVSKSELFDIALEHLSYVIADKGETVAVKEFRKHILWYIKGVKNAAEYKRRSGTVNTYSDCERLFDSIKNNIQE